MYFLASCTAHRELMFLGVTLTMKALNSPEFFKVQKLRTIIIPDLHNRVDWVEPALSSMRYDKVIFLRDYFDDFDDTVEDVKKVAKWLKQSLSKPGRIHLCGTHEMWYRFPDNPFLQASGNTEQKSDLINHILTAKDWNLLEFSNNHRLTSLLSSPQP